MWDLAEKFRKEHEEETGHMTTVEVVEEKRILPSQADRMDLGERIIEMADAEVDWICPECHRSGEDLGTTNRCPDCDERLREVLPDGGTETGGSERVAVDREVLEELVNTAKGDLERLVQCDGYREGDDVVDDLVETVEAAERSLEAGGDSQ